MAERSSGYLISFDVDGHGLWLACNAAMVWRDVLWSGTIDGALDKSKTDQMQGRISRTQRDGAGAGVIEN